MMCCDLSEATECVPNEIQEGDLCEHCPIVEKLSEKEQTKETLRILESQKIEEYEETLI
jgi:hypothetical protein